MHTPAPMPQSLRAIANRRVDRILDLLLSDDDDAIYHSLALSDDVPEGEMPDIDPQVLAAFYPGDDFNYFLCSPGEAMPPERAGYYAGIVGHLVVPAYCLEKEARAYRAPPGHLEDCMVRHWGPLLAGFNLPAAFVLLGASLPYTEPIAVLWAFKLLPPSLLLASLQLENELAWPQRDRPIDD